MNTFREKIRLVYAPFLWISLAFILSYTLLNWLLNIRLSLFSMNEDLVNLWLPLSLPWIPVLIWLRPGVRLLKMNRKSGNLPGLYLLVAAMTMFVPTMIAQQYLVSATGKMTAAENVSTLEHSSLTKYYTIRHHFIDKSRLTLHTAWVTSGKSNETITFHLYVACPLLTNAADTLVPAPKTWVGTTYSNSMSNRKSQQEKEDAYDAFYNESLNDFVSNEPAPVQYFDRIGHNDNREGYIKACRKSRYCTDAGKLILLEARYEPFDKRTVNKLAWIFHSFAIGAVVWLIMVLIPKFDEAALHKFASQNGLAESKTELKDFLQIFIPRPGFFATALIIDLNILVFAVMVAAGLGFLSFDAPDLQRWGGNMRSYTTNGQWWRLLTNIFLHGGFIHLLMNMIALMLAGIFAESLLGTKKFVLAYLLSGLLASVASIWMHDKVVSVGASGAIFGMYGVLLALLTTKVLPKALSRPLLLTVLFFIGYNLLVGLAGGIDNAAHIGGLLTGIVTGYVYYPFIKKDQPLAATSFLWPKSMRQR